MATSGTTPAAVRLSLRRGFSIVTPGSASGRTTTSTGCGDSPAKPSRSVALSVKRSVPSAVNVAAAPAPSIVQFNSGRGDSPTAAVWIGSRLASGLLNVARSVTVEPAAVTTGPFARSSVCVLPLGTYGGGTTCAVTPVTVSRGTTETVLGVVASSPAWTQTFSDPPAEPAARRVSTSALNVPSVWRVIRSWRGWPPSRA